MVKCKLLIQAAHVIMFSSFNEQLKLKKYKNIMLVVAPLVGIKVNVILWLHSEM